MAFSTSAHVSLENEMLVWCARTKLDSETAAAIRELAGKPLDWDQVVSQAEEHSVVPLVERNLRTAAALVPSACTAQLERIARENALRCLALTAELIRVMEALESRGISALPYKGPVIAAQAYGDITARQFEDLDIVLRQGDIRGADEVIRSLGYEPRFPWLHATNRARGIVPGEYNYSHPGRRTMVELHTECTLRHFPVRPDLNPFFQRAVKADLGGRQLPTFCAEDTLLLLCVHGAKDFWQRLVWIVDIAELLRSHPSPDWDLVLHTAGELRAERMVHVGLALAQELLMAKIPAEVFAKVNADSGTMNLAGDIEKRVLSGSASDPTGAERLRFRRRTVRGFFAGWMYAMRLAFAPAEEDWESARLSRFLVPLHLVLRPFRLLRKYGRLHRA